eukprot:jgi/Ulvmu1/706/UM010_0078.1
MLKLIIDTDPGIDDAMAILAAFNCSEVQVIGLTTLFGNVPVEMATDNAMLLRHIVSAHDDNASTVPVCPGSCTSFMGGERHRIADFVHGSDGFGDKRPALPQASPSAQSAADFIVEQVNKDPGNVSILALAACTNVALAIKADPSLPTKWKQLVILGGAFQVSGNVNPAAEANIFGDPEAADYVFKHTQGDTTYVVGLDVTHDCIFTGSQLTALKGQGKYGTFLSEITQFYLRYHTSFYGTEQVFVHDPTAFVACIRKEFFQWKQGAIVVAAEGALRGKALMDVSSRKWYGTNEWVERPKINVAMNVKSDELTKLCLSLMSM